MASSLAERAQTGWVVTRQAGARPALVSLAPVLVTLVVFKLAISDGGRDALSLTMAQVAIFATFAVLVWTGRTRLGGIGRAMLVMVGVMALTSLTSVRPEASVRDLLLWTMYLGIFVITASTLTGPAAARRMLDTLVAIAGWLVLIALFMFWGANNPGMRWYSTFYWPNPFAAFLLLVVPLELVRLAHARAAREVLAHAALMVLLVTAFMLTYSRGAWLSLLAIGPVGAALLRPPSWRSAAVRILIVGMIVVAAVMLLTATGSARREEEGVVSRVGSITDAGDVSIQGRVSFWRAAWGIFTDHPVLGTGPGTFSVVHPRYQQDPRFFARDAHNLYLQTAAEMGLPGIAGIAILLLSLVRLWRRTLRQTPSQDEYPLVLGCGLGLLAFFIHSGLDMDWMFPANPALASALAGVLTWYDRSSPADLQVGQPERQHWHRLAAAALVVAIVAVGVAYAAHRAFVRGKQYAVSGRWAEAAGEYTRAVRLNPLRAQYLSALSAAHSQLGARSEAEGLLRRAMTMDRANPTHSIQLAELLRIRDASGPWPAEAEALLRHAIALDPLNRPEAYRILARVYLQMGRTDAAAEVYREAIPRYLGRGLSLSMPHILLWPEIVHLALDASEFFLHQSDLTTATGFLRQILHEDPANVRAALRLATIYLRQGDDYQAREVLNAIAARVPNHPEVQTLLARLR